MWSISEFQNSMKMETMEWQHSDSSLSDRHYPDHCSWLSFIPRLHHPRARCKSGEVLVDPGRHSDFHGQRGPREFPGSKKDGQHSHRFYFDLFRSAFPD